METNRIFKDLELVEQLGAGIPHVLQTYDKACFKFSDNYIRMSFPSEKSEKSEKMSPKKEVSRLLI